jgi:hypothetical protein
MKRREFLKTGALLVASTAAVAAGLLPLASAETVVPALKSLKPDEARTLQKMCRCIFPHRRLGDAPYWRVVADLDQASSTDPSLAKLLTTGLAQLQSSQAVKFDDLDAKEQINALKAIQRGEFFQKVRSLELASLYSDPAVWKELGYQGPSYPFGGYAHRGFNDLNWLPDPPASASPKPM